MNPIVDVITLLLGLSGFSLAPNPKPATGDAVLQYAIADADLVAHVDIASIVPGNYKKLVALADQPQIKASPELAKIVRKAVAEIEGPRGLVKNMVGIDITTDVSDATAFLRFVPKADPNVVVAVHGKFKPDSLTKIAKMTRTAEVKDAGGVWVDLGDGNAVALTKSGVLLAGSTPLVKERVATTWQKPALTAGTNLGNIAEVIKAKPVFAVFMTLSQAARTEALAKMQGQNFATDVIKRHKLASFAIYHDGVGWSWIDNNKAGLEAMGQISEGGIEVLRAAQIAPRGFAKIVMGALESYRGTNKQVDELLKRKADIWKLVSSYSGDGNFKAQVDKDPAKLTLKVRLSGKSLSEVLPAGGIVPFAVLGWLTVGKAEAVPPPTSSTIAAPPAAKPLPLPPPPPPKKGGAAAPPKKP